METLILDACTCYLIPTAPRSPAPLFCFQQSHPIKRSTLGHWPFWKLSFASSVCVSHTTHTLGAFSLFWVLVSQGHFGPNVCQLPQTYYSQKDESAPSLNWHTFSMLFSVKTIIHTVTQWPISSLMSSAGPGVCLSSTFVLSLHFVLPHQFTDKILQFTCQSICWLWPFSIVCPGWT